MKIIRINYLTYYFLGILFLSGMIKIGLIIFIIVFIHEMGHFIAAKINRYDVSGVTIYPFGGITRVNVDLNSPLKKDFILAIGGFLGQLLLVIVILFLYEFNFISSVTYNLFIQYNIYICLFNMLPIIPLDGSKIMDIILNHFFSFKRSYIINIIISILCIILYLFINYKYSINNYLIVSFLVFKIIDSIKNKNIIFNKFYLERYLKDYNYKKINNYSKINLNKLKKEEYFYFWNKSKWSSEKKFLKEKFK